MPTVTTRSGGIALINPLHADPQPRRLLGEVAGELPMWPLADLLVGHAAQTDARLDVAHISHRDACDALACAEIHHLARRLVEQIPLLAIHPRTHLGFALEQPFGTAGARLAAAYLLLQHAVDLVAPLLARTELPP